MGEEQQEKFVRISRLDDGSGNGQLIVNANVNLEMQIAFLEEAKGLVLRKVLGPDLNVAGGQVARARVPAFMGRKVDSSK